MSAAKTLFSFDTKLSADTVEWCPHFGFENILVVGSYQVNKSDNEVFDDTQRYGRIYVFQCENSTFKVQIYVKFLFKYKYNIIYKGANRD